MRCYEPILEGKNHKIAKNVKPQRRKKKPTRPLKDFPKKPRGSCSTFARFRWQNNPIVLLLFFGKSAAALLIFKMTLAGFFLESAPIWANDLGRSRGGIRSGGSGGMKKNENF